MENNIEEKIINLAFKYAKKLDSKILGRIEEMKNDDKSHFLIYQVLGVKYKEGEDIDIYQNKGRFLYNYAGMFLEEVASLCFKEVFPHSSRLRITNTLGNKPKNFEIDCLIGNDALEIKWKDATTDGDHITKEHNRIRVIKESGYNPVRIMFYYPNREQAMRIQEVLKAIYHDIGGEYHAGDDAWKYIYSRTGINLKEILINIAKKNERDE